VGGRGFKVVAFDPSFQDFGVCLALSLSLLLTLFLSLLPFFLSLFLCVGQFLRGRAVVRSGILHGCWCLTGCFQSLCCAFRFLLCCCVSCVFSLSHLYHSLPRGPTEQVFTPPCPSPPCTSQGRALQVRGTSRSSRGHPPQSHLSRTKSA